MPKRKTAQRGEYWEEELGPYTGGWGDIAPLWETEEYQDMNPELFIENPQERIQYELEGDQEGVMIAPSLIKRAYELEYKRSRLKSVDFPQNPELLKFIEYELGELIDTIGAEIFEDPEFEFEFLDVQVVRNIWATSRGKGLDDRLVALNRVLNMYHGAGILASRLLGEYGPHYLYYLSNDPNLPKEWDRELLYGKISSKNNLEIRHMSKERDLDLRKKFGDESNPDWEMNYTEKSDEWPHKNKDDGDQYPYYRHPFHNKPGRKPGDGDQGNLFNANPADKTFYDIASKIEGNEIFDRYFLKDGHAWLSAVIFKKAHGDLKVGDVVISFGKTLKENNTICKRFGSVQKANESINETVREIFAVMSPMTPTDDTVLQEHQGLRPDQPGAYLKRKSPLPGKEDPSEIKDKRQHQGYDYPALNPHRSPIPFEDDSIGATSTIKRSQGPQHIKSILEQIMEPISQAKTLEEAQEIAINHISASNINEKDKQTMIATFRGARNLERFLQSFYNALLKYEGFGVVSKNFNRIARIAWNPKTLVDAKEEIKPLVPYNQRVYVESMQSVAELQNTFVRNLSKVLAVDLEKIRKLLEETEAKAPNYSKAMYLTLLPLYPILTHPNVFEYTTPENLRWVVVDAIHMSSYLTDEQKNWSLHIVKQFNFDAEMGVLNFVRWVSNSILRGGGLGVQRLERPKVEKVPPQADFPPPEYAPEEPVEALPFKEPLPEEEEEEDEDTIITSSDTHVKVFGSFKNEADVNLGIQELGLVGCFGGFTPTEGYFIASAKDTPQMNSIQATAILGRIKKGHSSYFDAGRLGTFEPSQVDAQLRAEAVGRVLTPSMKSLILEHAEQGLTLQEIANKLNLAFETDVVKPQHVRTFLKRVLERPSLMEKYKKRRITPEVDVPRPERTEREKAIEEKKREYELLQAQPEGQAWFKEIEDPTKKREREDLPVMPPKEWKPTKKVVEKKPEGEWQPAARVPTTPMTTQELKNTMQQMDKMIQEGQYPESVGALMERHPWMSQIVSQEQLKPLGPLPESGKVSLTEEELQIAVEDLQKMFTGQAKRAQVALQFPEDTGLESTVADNLRQMLQNATVTNDPAHWFQYGQEFLNAFNVRGLTITETVKQHVRDVIRQLNPAAPLNQVESILARNAPGEMLEYLQSMYSTESPTGQMTSGLYETIRGLMMESPTAPIIAQKLSFRSTKQNIEEAHKRADIDKEIPLEKVEEKPKVVYIEEEVKIRVADKLTLKKTSQEGRIVRQSSNKTKVPKLALRKSSEFTGGRFVVHKHDEIKEGLHYDLRLEWPEGSLEKYQEERKKETPEPKGDEEPKTVLRCWVIQKGIPEKLGEERSAVLIEDHPISYMSFEGTIPEGSYGGGEVEIFDSGTYDLIKKTSNKIAVDLQGKKIKGHYNLTKTDSNWLLAKCEGKAGKLNAEGALDWYDLPEEDRNLLTTITRGIEHQLNHDAEILAAKLKDDRFYFDLMDIVEKVGIPKEKVDLYTFIIHDLLTIDLASFSDRPPEPTEGPEPGKQATIPLPVRMTLDYPHSWRKDKKETPTEKKKKEFEYKKALDLRKTSKIEVPPMPEAVDLTSPESMSVEESNTWCEYFESLDNYPETKPLLEKVKEFQLYFSQHRDAFINMPPEKWDDLMGGLIEASPNPYATPLNQEEFKRETLDVIRNVQTWEEFLRGFVEDSADMKRLMSFFNQATQLQDVPGPVREYVDQPESFDLPGGLPEGMANNKLNLKKVADFDQAIAQTSDIDPKVENRIKEIQKEIPEEDLYPEEDEEGWVKDGKQTLLHMTVLYGVEDDDIPEIKELFQRHSKISVGTDKIHYFDQDDYTAAVLRCQSDEIRDLHGKLKRKLDVKEDYATYKPHITIAYLQPGKRLENEEFPNIKWEIDSIDVVKSSGKLQKIKKETSQSKLSLKKQASTPAEHEQQWNHPPSTYRYDGLQENPSGEPFIQLTCNTCGSTILSTLEELKPFMNQIDFPLDWWR